MGKNLLVGIGGKARHVKALYVGVGGKARKVKKVYIGVGGRARLVWQDYVYVTGISLSNSGKNSLAIISATITPSNAQNKTLIWTIDTTYFGFFEHKTDSDGGYWSVMTDANNKPLNNLTGYTHAIATHMLNRASASSPSRISVPLTVRSADGNASATMIFTAHKIDENGIYYYVIDPIK